MKAAASGLAGRVPSIGLLRRRQTSPYADKVRSIFGGSLIEHWPLWEVDGSVAAGLAHGYNGVYTACTLGQPGAGDGRTAVSLDGATSYINAYSTRLRDAFTAGEFTIEGWFQVSGAGVYTDGVVRRVAHLAADASNRALLLRTVTNNQLQFLYQAGGTSKSVTTSYSGTGWTHMAMTVSKSADQMIAYLNGVQVGTTQTGLGTWAGSLSSTQTLLGAAATTPTNVWSGLLQHFAVGNRPLTAAEIAALAVMP